MIKGKRTTALFFLIAVIILTAMNYCACAEVPVETVQNINYSLSIPSVFSNWQKSDDGETMFAEGTVSLKTGSVGAGKNLIRVTVSESTNVMNNGDEIIPFTLTMNDKQIIPGEAKDLDATPILSLLANQEGEAVIKIVIHESDIEKVKRHGAYLGEITYDVDVLLDEGQYGIVKPISELEASPIPAQTFDGLSPCTPAVTITDNGYQLVKDVDFTVEYEYNYLVEGEMNGTGAAIVTGINKYCDMKIIEFEINRGATLEMSVEDGELSVSENAPGNT